MVEKEITGPALQEMYKRRQVELRASHILISIPENPSPADTALAFARAKAIIDSLRAGRNFDTLALNNSQDRSVKDNRGDLYYFSSGAMVPEFEDVAFSLQPGQFTTTPARTQFGYHIIKVTDRKPNRGSLNVSHIMKRLSSDPNPAELAEAMEVMRGALDSLKKGVDFGELAKKISEDTYSGPRGGDIGVIQRRRTVKEFDEAAFKLQPGEVSGIVHTRFGLHLIKCNSAVELPAFKNMEQELKSEYQRTRFQSDYNKIAGQVKTQYNFQQYDDAATALTKQADTSKTTSDAKWDSTITKATRAKTLFSIANEKVSVDSFIVLAKANPELRDVALKSAGTIPTMLEKIGKNLIMEYHARTMETKFPDFSKTMKEYEEGILLFKAEQEQVWNKVAPNDSVLRIYYNANKEKYTWTDRVNVQEIFVETDSTAQLVKKSLLGYTKTDTVVTKSKKGKTTTQIVSVAVAPISFDSAAVLFNKRQATQEKHGASELVLVSTNDVTNKGWTMNPKDSMEYFPNEGGFSFVKLIKKDPARIKTFEEAGSELSSAYQEAESKRLGDVWYENLKKKYPVVIFKENIVAAPQTQERKSN